MILSIVLAVLGIAGLIVFYFTTAGAVRKKIISFVLLFAALFSACSYAVKLDISLSLTYTLISVGALLCGILFLLILKKFVPALKIRKKWHTWLLITLPVLLGAAGFNYFFGPWYGSELASSVLTVSFVSFIVPLLLLAAFKQRMAIPELEYQAWQFPQYPDFDFDSVDTSDLMLITLALRPNDTDSTEVSFKVKAPRAIEFQYFFVKFIEDYNNRNPESAINPWYNSNEEPIGWQFFIKPSFLGDKKYLDTGQTIASNRLKESNIIVAERVILTEQEPVLAYE
jgi:hypothetical protein